MNRTKIEWVKNPDGTQGYTWNPITGCLNGCEYCYARRLANTRLRARYLANTNLPEFTPDIIPYGKVSQMYIQKCFNNPFYPRFWEERLLKPAKGLSGYLRTKSKGIFVCDMSDLFGIGIPEDWQKRVLAQIKIYKQHRFYLLTKQPQNLIKWSPFPDNCYVGVTATDSSHYIDAISGLAHIEAKIKYISFEPLLASCDQPTSSYLDASLGREGISWVIIGAQTKPYKPPGIEWIEDISMAAARAGIPLFMKDNLRPLLEPKHIVVRQEIPEVIKW